MSRLGGLHDNAKVTVQAFLNSFGALFSAGSATVGTATSWQVSQRAAGANMSIDVAAGAGLIQSTSFPYAPWSDATENLVVSTANPSNPRRDIVVAYLNLAAFSTAANNGPNALNFMVVAGTPGASPSDPTSSAIQTAVGAGNPWIYLARIRIGTPGSYVAPSNITNSMIDDLRQPIALKGRVWGGSNNTSGHKAPNVVDDTLALLGIAQTFVGAQTFQGGISLPAATTYSNPGSAGGSFFQLSLGNIKLFWGRTSSIAVAGTGFQSTTRTVTLPNSFFANIDMVQLTVDPPTATQFLGAGVSTVSTSTINVNLNQSNGANGSAGINVFVLGS